MPELKESSFQDVYSELGRLCGGQEQIKERLMEIADKLSRLHCDSHMDRLNKIEAIIEKKLTPVETRPARPASAGYPAIIAQLEGRVAKAEEDAHELVDEATGKIRIEAIAAAQAAAIEAMKRREQEREEEKEKRTKRFHQWLQIIATTLTILGGGGIVASVKFMYSADAKMERQASALEKQRVVIIKSSQKPDANNIP